jgi:hypothetical protein
LACTWSHILCAQAWTFGPHLAATHTILIPLMYITSWLAPKQGRLFSDAVQLSRVAMQMYMQLVSRVHQQYP